ncbi:MAG: type II secretion system F family protein, partial [Patescibacteria group bacterium]
MIRFTFLNVTAKAAPVQKKTVAQPPGVPTFSGHKRHAKQGGFLSIFTRVYGTPRFSIKDQMLFAKRLSFLVGANVPILESFHVLKEQTRSSRVRHVYERIIHDIENGQALSKSLHKFGKTFTPFAINLIRVGELSGSLAQSLIYLAEELKKRYILKGKIVSALVYPIIITVATLGITGLLTVFIFPKIMPIFASLNVELPLTTRILLAVSTFLQNYGLWVIAGLFAGSIVFVFLYRKVSVVRFATDRT